MGIIETVIDLNRQEAAEEGMEKGILLNDLENKLIFLNKFRERNFSIEDLAEMTNSDMLFVKDFEKGYTKEKLTKLLTVLKKSKKMNELDLLKTHLLKSLHLFGFSVPVLVKYFKMKKGLIEKILNTIN